MENLTNGDIGRRGVQNLVFLRWRHFLMAPNQLSLSPKAVSN